MAKISSNIEKETFDKIISSLKSSRIEYFDIAEHSTLSQKSCYFHYEGNTYFIHSINGKIDVINLIGVRIPEITPKKEENSKLDIYSELVIYSDGGCSPNPGEGGCGLAMYDGNKFITAYYGLYMKECTNNIAELNSLNAALLFAKQYIDTGVKKVTIKTDSKYSISCLTEWIDAWVAKGWKNSKKEPVKNKEIISPMYELYKKIKTNIVFEHVRGHVGIEGNEVADRMATLAISSKSEKLLRCNDSLSQIPHE
jgi:ribonuclease HI